MILSTGGGGGGIEVVWYRVGCVIGAGLFYVQHPQPDTAPMVKSQSVLECKNAFLSYLF